MVNMNTVIRVYKVKGRVHHLFSPPEYLIDVMRLHKLIITDKKLTGSYLAFKCFKSFNAVETRIIDINISRSGVPFAISHIENNFRQAFT